MRAWKLVLSCVAAATMVTIACDAAHLIDSDAQGTVYALADVDGEPLPLEYTPRYTFHGVGRVVRAVVYATWRVLPANVR